MPYYDFKCAKCQTVEEHYVRLGNLDKVVCCPLCGDEAIRQFPVSAILGFQPFEAYYDEVLDCDVSGRREKKQILVAEGLVEAGDKQGVARKFDRHAPDHIKPRPPRGRSYAEMKRHDTEVQRQVKEPNIRGEE